MKITDELQDFLNDSANYRLVNENKFTNLYENIYEHSKKWKDTSLIQEFTLLLYNAGIDPLQYMEEVPNMFLYNSLYTRDGTINQLKTNFIIPDNVIDIGAAAFAYSCITKIKIPDSVKIIHDVAFMGTRLTEVELGTGIKFIYENVFNQTGIKVIKYKGTMEQWNKITIAPENDRLFLAIIECDDGKKLSYNDDEGSWEETP